MAVPSIGLNDDNAMPALGLGVAELSDADTERAVSAALEIGYRLIDTASAYGNEAAVGRAIAASGIPRAEIFLTTKLAIDDQGYQSSQDSIKASLERLGMDYVDLYLIHWPVPAHDRYVDTWRAFVDLQAEGLIRAIGVSNFEPEYLDRVIAETGATPAINQVELHPYFQQRALRREHERLGIVTESWSPLAQGQALEHPTIVHIAEAHSRTPGQVVIRWHLQLGLVVIPKSVTPERIAQNFDVLDFRLSDTEMGAIGDLDEGRRIGPDPRTFVLP
jgi:2,5-diketo-D-gluconate reductase A